MASKSAHRVVLHFDDGLMLKLICPESGCSPASVCGECHRSVDDGERDPCPSCPRPEDGCWVKGWFDNCTYDELLYGEITAELDCEWDGDRIIATVTESTVHGEAFSAGRAQGFQEGVREAMARFT